MTPQGKTRRENRQKDLLLKETLYNESSLDIETLARSYLDFCFDPQKTCLKLGPLEIFIQKLENIPHDKNIYAVVVRVGGFGEGHYGRYFSVPEADAKYHHVCEEVNKGNYSLELENHRVRLRIPGEEERLGL